MLFFNNELLEFYCDLRQQCSTVYWFLTTCRIYIYTLFINLTKTFDFNENTWNCLLLHLLLTYKKNQKQNSYHLVAGLTKPNWLLETRQKIKYFKSISYFLWKENVSTFQNVSVFTRSFIFCTDVLAFGVLQTLEVLPLPRLTNS